MPYTTYGNFEIESVKSFEEDEKNKEYQSDKEEYGEIPYEPEEAEAALRFIQTVITEFIKRVIPETPRVLSLEKASKCLKNLGKIWNLSEYPPVTYLEESRCKNSEERLMDMEGYVDEYQYLHIEVVDLALTNIKVIPQNFVWLLSADLSGNRLNNQTACPITKLPNLVALHLNRNRFEDAYLPPMKHLQYLGLSYNKIDTLHRIYHPNLETLGLNFNEIKEIDASDCSKLTKLSQLELRGNKLTTTAGIEYQNLVNLYLAENQITELKGLEFLVNLERLHLRQNPLSDLSGFTSSNINLKYLNIRKCQINSPEDLSLLSVLKGLRELIVKGNHFNPEPEKRKKTNSEGEFEDEDEGEGEDEEEYEEEEDEEDDEALRIQILMILPNLTRIDKKLVTKEERNMKDALE